METEGLPLFLHSFLEQLIQEQMLILGENGFRFNRSAQELHEATFELPPTIRQMLHRQLDGITDDAISILQLLAVSGQPLSSDQLLDCLDIETNDFFDQLEPLIAHKLLRENAPVLMSR